jgi:hypothetical protein
VGPPPELDITGHVLAGILVSSSADGEPGGCLVRLGGCLVRLGTKGGKRLRMDRRVGKSDGGHECAAINRYLPAAVAVLGPAAVLDLGSR